MKPIIVLFVFALLTGCASFDKDGPYPCACNNQQPANPHIDV